MGRVVIGISLQHLIAEDELDSVPWFDLGGGVRSSEVPVLVPCRRVISSESDSVLW